MRVLLSIAVICAPLALSGCMVGKVVTAPIRAAGTVVETAVDATTQSQSEKEEDVGRRVLAQRKKDREACLKTADSRAERRDCKKRFSDDY